MNMGFKMFGHSLKDVNKVEDTPNSKPAEFITSNVFVTGVWIIRGKTLFPGKVLFWFNSCFFMLGFFKGIDLHRSLPYLFSIFAIASLVIYVLI